MKVNIKNILMLVAIVIVVIIGVTVASQYMDNDEELTYSDIVEMFEDDIVVSFVVDNNLSLKLKTLTPELDEKGEYKKDPNGDIIFKTNEKGEPIHTEYTYVLSWNFQIENLNELAKKNYEKEGSNLVEYDYTPPIQTPWYVAYLPYIIVAAIFIILLIFAMKQAPGGTGKMNTFAKSKLRPAQDDKDAVKFADVAGADEEKAELEEIVEFLKDPEKFIKLGARIPRGVLLVGPPGTGKTLLAKAVAGEAGVPFFSISGSDFVEMYVGVGASRVRELFDNARKTQASIIFIDEIDAVGRHRGAGLGGGHDEREQTLNQLLVEMDGFGTNSGVIVLAATNRPDILDPALLRPGRFDRRVTVNYPDIKGREAILKVHCRNKPLESSVDLKKIAQTTIGFTGAELANLMNEAALRAAKKNKALIGMEDIEESYMKMLLGPQKKSAVRTPNDNKLCAYHEAGHAVASYFCKHTDPVKHITIIPAGYAGGVTISVPTEDRMTTSRNEMLDEIVLSLGGRVAEELVLDDISTGASSDIRQATSVARNMITKYGMSEKLGTVLYGSEHSDGEVFLGRDFSSGRSYSEKTAAEIDDEIRDIINNAYARCKQILSDNIAKLHFVASFLFKNESMDEEQFRVAMETENPTIEEIENIASKKKAESEKENKNAHEKNEAKEKTEKTSQNSTSEEPKTHNDGNLEEFFKNVWRAPEDEKKTDAGEKRASESTEPEKNAEPSSSDTAENAEGSTEKAKSDPEASVSENLENESAEANTSENSKNESAEDNK